MVTSTHENGVNASAANGQAKPAVVCVFCGASNGQSPEHMAAARELAQTFHRKNVKLVYGGGNVGIMGEVARTLVQLSGPDAVHGVIPKALIEFERGSEQGSKLPKESEYGRTTIVKNMHERKQLMAREVISGGPGSGFVVLSGGFGTLEEAMENATWNQLGIHAQPVVLFNVAGYWDAIIQWVRTAVSEKFISEQNGNIMVEAKTSDEVMQRLQDYKVSAGRYKLNWDAL